MKNKLFGIITICAALCLTACSQKKETADTLAKINERGKIIVGVKFDTKPFGYLDDKKQPTGFDVDIAKAIAKSLLGDETKVEFKPVTSANRILILNSGKVDMIIATMTITPKRQQIIDFSMPYHMTGQAILVNEGSDITSIQDLNGKKVIIVFGSTAESRLRIMAPDAKIMGFKTYTSAFNALKGKKADAITSDETILLGWAMEHNDVKLLGQNYSKEYYGVGFRKGNENLSLKNRVNFILSSMTKNGELKSIKRKWINKYPKL